jgi:hypothetical protein
MLYPNPGDVAEASGARPHLLQAHGDADGPYRLVSDGCGGDPRVDDVDRSVPTEISPAGGVLPRPQPSADRPCRRRTRPPVICRIPGVTEAWHRSCLSSRRGAAGLANMTKEVPVMRAVNRVVAGLAVGLVILAGMVWRLPTTRRRDNELRRRLPRRGCQRQLHARRAGEWRPIALESSEDLRLEDHVGHTIKVTEVDRD